MHLKKIVIFLTLIPLSLRGAEHHTTIHVLSEQAHAQFSGPSQHHYHPPAGHEGVRGVLIGGLKFGVMEFIAQTVVTVLKKISSKYAPWIYREEKDPHLKDLQKKKATLELELLELDKKEKEKNLLTSMSTLLKEKESLLTTLRRAQSQADDSKEAFEGVEKEYLQALHLYMQRLQNFVKD